MPINIHVKSGSVAEYVRNLASVNRITHTRSMLGAWADNVTRLAGDDVELDDVPCLTWNFAKLKY